MPPLEFVRFPASDGIVLQGWLSGAALPGSGAVVHVHGMSGNGYENVFIDTMRERCHDAGVAFLAFDNRGRGAVSDFRRDDGSWLRAGSCYERFAESSLDIAGALEFVASLDKRNVIITGHSLGCAKVVHFLASGQPRAMSVGAAVLLAPTDMVAWARMDPRHAAFRVRARELVDAGSPRTVIDSSCWQDETPLSAATYLDLSEPGGPVDIFASSTGTNVAAALERTAVPTVIVYGTEDTAVLHEGGLAGWVANRPCLAGAHRAHRRRRS